MTISFAKLAQDIWRAWITDGMPASGVWNPSKSDIRDYGTTIETALNAHDGLLSATPGAVAPSKAAIPDANGDLRGGRNLALSGLLVRARTVTSYSTAGGQTYTAAAIVGGIIVRDPSGASRTDTLPTAAAIVAAVPGAAIGDTIDCKIINGADAAETITIAVPTGGSFDVNQSATSRVIGQNNSKSISIRLTGVASGSEGYVVYV